MIPPDTGTADLRHVAQITFSHDPLMQLVGALHAILELAVMFWQFFSDDVCAPWNVEGGRKKHSLTDLELIKRHDTPSPNHNIIYEIPG